ncbi:MAG: hypothetical protein Q8N89_06125 [Azonexus sp.]|nr:hypothetical protein [Azonexus sp.]
MKPQLTAHPCLVCRVNTGSPAFDAIHPLADSATRRLARLLGPPAWSLLLAGMSLLRPQWIPIPAAQGAYRRLAPAIPPRRTICRVQLRFQG